MLCWTGHCAGLDFSCEIGHCAGPSEDEEEAMDLSWEMGHFAGAAFCAEWSIGRFAGAAGEDMANWEAA